MSILGGNMKEDWYAYQLIEGARQMIESRDFNEIGDIKKLEIEIKKLLVAYNKLVPSISFGDENLGERKS